MRSSYTLYRTEAAGALAQLEEAHERIFALTRENEALRAEIAQLRRASSACSGQYQALDAKRAG
jgi:hypothetical protein